MCSQENIEFSIFENFMLIKDEYGQQDEEMLRNYSISETSVIRCSI